MNIYIGSNSAAGANGFRDSFLVRRRPFELHGLHSSANNGHSWGGDLPVLKCEKPTSRLVARLNQLFASHQRQYTVSGLTFYICVDICGL